MRRTPLFSFALLLLATASAGAQTSTQTTSTQTRPRTVTTQSGQQQQTGAKPSTAATPPQSGSQKPAPPPAVPSSSTTSPRPVVTSNVPMLSQSSAPAIGLPSRHLSMDKIRLRKTEAQRLMKARAVPTVLTTTTAPSLSPSTAPSPTAPSTTSSLQLVTLAALEQESSKIHLITLSKESFLDKGAEMTLTTSLGTLVRLRIVRANGVNTAVTIFDTAGHVFVPLVVEYPIERGGRLQEMAYYTSAHPAIISPEVIKAGQAYVRTMVDLAARRLKEKGVALTPDILNMAERLCVVEHTDHTRFSRENRIALFEEIFALFALNELDTYRYAVSTAGAGGMVQMIPSTYQMLRRMHPGIGLNPDFVYGMRNHGNALEAMLLYINDTWKYLAANPDVDYALKAKIATQAELLAAGYNSNPARLPGYINRAGADWRSLIPRETQLYLQIYRSLDSLIPMKPRS